MDSSIEIDGNDDNIASIGSMTVYDRIAGSSTQDGDIDHTIRGIRMQVSSHDWDAKLVRCCMHSIKHVVPDSWIRDGENINHRDRSSSHGGNIMDIYKN